MNDIYNVYYNAKTQAWDIWGPGGEFITYRLTQKEAISYVKEYAATRARLQGQPAPCYKAEVKSPDHLRFRNVHGLTELEDGWDQILRKEDELWKDLVDKAIASYVPSGALDPSQPQATPDLLYLMQDL
jgi:hypothetical protein